MRSYNNFQNLTQVTLSKTDFFYLPGNQIEKYSLPPAPYSLLTAPPRKMARLFIRLKMQVNDPAIPNLDHLKFNECLSCRVTHPFFCECKFFLIFIFWFFIAISRLASYLWAKLKIPITIIKKALNIYQFLFLSNGYGY